MEISWRTFIIECAKLFAKRNSELFNLNAYLAALERNDEDSDRTSVQAEQIVAWKNRLEQPACLIDNILKQRDKEYNHTDDDFEIIKIISPNWMPRNYYRLPMRCYIK